MEALVFSQEQEYLRKKCLPQHEDGNSPNSTGLL